MLCPQTECEEFEFYLKFCKPLVYNLPDQTDRVIAAQWVKKLRDTFVKAEIKLEYLKLLLFLLVKRRLLGPFSEAPEQDDDLTLPYPIPDNFSLPNVAKNFIVLEQEAKAKSLKECGYGDWPPYIATYSSDFKEYASIQNIPNFGVQGYFATSREPLNTWLDFDKAIIPSGAVFPGSSPIQDKDASLEISCFVDPKNLQPIKTKLDGDQDFKQKEVKFDLPCGSSSIKLKSFSQVVDGITKESRQSSSTPNEGSPTKYSEALPKDYYDSDTMEDSVCTSRIPCPKDPKCQIPRRTGSPRTRSTSPSSKVKHSGEQTVKKDEVRIPPSWGSNLIHVTDKPKATKGKSSVALENFIAYFGQLTSSSEDIQIKTLGRTMSEQNITSSSTDTSYWPRTISKIKAFQGLAKNKNAIKKLKQNIVSKEVEDKSFERDYEFSKGSIGVLQEFSKGSFSPKRLPKPPSRFLRDLQMHPCRFKSKSFSSIVSKGRSPSLKTKRQMYNASRTQPKSSHPRINNKNDKRFSLTISPKSAPNSQRPTAVSDKRKSLFTPPTRDNCTPRKRIMTSSPIPMIFTPEQQSRSHDFSWMDKNPCECTLPEDEALDPSLWQSYGWWDKDPNVIFNFQQEDSPGKINQQKAEEPLNLGNTPPVFSRDSDVRQKVLAGVEYDPSEFGLVDVPSWIAADQYLSEEFTCKPEDPRDKSRRTPVRQSPASPRRAQHPRQYQTCNQYSTQYSHDPFSSPSEMYQERFNQQARDYNPMDDLAYTGPPKDFDQSISHEAVAGSSTYDSEFYQDCECPSSQKTTDSARNRSNAWKFLVEDDLFPDDILEESIPFDDSFTSGSPIPEAPRERSTCHQNSPLERRDQQERNMGKTASDGRKVTHKYTADRQQNNSPKVASPTQRGSSGHKKQFNQSCTPQTPTQNAGYRTKSFVSIKAEESSFSQDDMVLKNIETKKGSPEANTQIARWLYHTPPQFKARTPPAREEQTSYTYTLNKSTHYSPGREYFEAIEKSPFGEKLMEQSPPADFGSPPRRSPETGPMRSPGSRPMGTICSEQYDDLMSEEMPADMRNLPSPEHKQKSSRNSTAGFKSGTSSSYMNIPGPCQQIAPVRGSTPDGSNFRTQQEQTPKRYQYDPLAVAFRQEVDLKERHPYSPNKSIEVQCGKRRLKLKRGLKPPELTTITEHDEPPRARDHMQQIPKGPCSPCSPAVSSRTVQAVTTPKRGMPAVYPNDPSPYEGLIENEDLAKLEIRRYEYNRSKPQANVEQTPRGAYEKGKPRRQPKRLSFDESCNCPEPQGNKRFGGAVAEDKRSLATATGRRPTNGRPSRSPTDKLQDEQGILVPILSPEIDIFQKPNLCQLLHSDNIQEEDLPPGFQDISTSPVCSCDDMNEFLNDSFNIDNIQFDESNYVDVSMEQTPPRPGDSPEGAIWDMHAAVKRHERQRLTTDAAKTGKYKIPRLEEVTEDGPQYPFWDHRRLPQVAQERLTEENRRQRDEMLRAENEWLKLQQRKQMEEKRRVFEENDQWVKAQQEKKRKEKETQIRDQQAARRAKLSPKMLARIQQARNLQRVQVDSPEMPPEEPKYSPKAPPVKWIYQTPPQYQTPTRSPSNTQQDQEFPFPDYPCTDNLFSCSPPDMNALPESPEESVTPQQISSPFQTIEDQWDYYVRDDATIDSEMEPEFVTSPQPLQMDPLDKAWKQEIDLKEKKKMNKKMYWELQYGSKTHKTMSKPSLKPQLKTIQEQDAEFEQDVVPVWSRRLIPDVYPNTPPTPVRISREQFPHLPSPYRREFNPCRPSQVQPDSTPKSSKRGVRPKKLSYQDISQATDRSPNVVQNQMDEPPSVPCPETCTQKWAYETTKSSPHQTSPYNLEELANEAGQLFDDTMPELMDELPDTPEGSQNFDEAQLEEYRCAIADETAPEWAPEGYESSPRLSDEDIWNMHQRVTRQEVQQIRRRPDVAMRTGKTLIPIIKAGRPRRPSLEDVQEQDEETLEAQFEERVCRVKEQYSERIERMPSRPRFQPVNVVSPELPSVPDSYTSPPPQVQWSYLTPPKFKTPPMQTRQNSPCNKTPASYSQHTLSSNQRNYFQQSPYQDINSMSPPPDLESPSPTYQPPCLTERDIFEEYTQEDIFQEQTPEFTQTPTCATPQQRNASPSSPRQADQRVVRSPQKLQQGRLVANTPPSAQRTPKEQNFGLPEPVRFEQQRGKAMQRREAQFTPMRAPTVQKPNRRVVKDVKTCKRSLQAELELVEKEHEEMLRQKFNQLSTTQRGRGRDIEETSPPRMSASPQQEKFDEVNYEPQDFDFFRSPGDANCYCGPAFEGQPGQGLFSPGHTDRLSEDERNFKWIDRLQKR